MSAVPEIALEMAPDIIYEDNHLVAVNKPAGLLTQGALHGAPNLLDDLKIYIKKRDEKPGNVYLGMVQRLDRPVSGVIVFAKTSKAARRLSESIRDRKVIKLYVALTSDRAENGNDFNAWRKIEHYLLRKRDMTIIGDQADRSAQHGVLQFKTLFSNGRHAIHLVHLLTGRKHQIRAQLSHMGLPICGDRKYGSVDNFSDQSIGLHALCFRAAHPVRKEELAVVCPPPPHFYSYLSDTEKKQIAPLFDRDDLLRLSHSQQGEG